MRPTTVLLAAAASMLLPLTFHATVAEAADPTRTRLQKRDANKDRKPRDDAYAARANDLDPAGDYKRYPNWARAALSPKFDGGGSRR
jgi:Ni/Co efflux regulator RcnB